MRASSYGIIAAAGLAAILSANSAYPQNSLENRVKTIQKANAAKDEEFIKLREAIIKEEAEYVMGEYPSLTTDSHIAVKFEAEINSLLDRYKIDTHSGSMFVISDGKKIRIRYLYNEKVSQKGEEFNQSKVGLVVLDEFSAKHTPDNYNGQAINDYNFFEHKAARKRDGTFGVDIDWHVQNLADMFLGDNFDETYRTIRDLRKQIDRLVDRGEKNLFFTRALDMEEQMRMIKIGILSSYEIDLDKDYHGISATKERYIRAHIRATGGIIKVSWLRDQELSEELSEREHQRVLVIRANGTATLSSKEDPNDSWIEMPVFPRIAK